MDAEFPCTAKVYGYKAVNHVFHLANSIVRRVRPVIYQFPLVEFTRDACQTVEGGNALQQFQAI